METLLDASFKELHATPFHISTLVIFALAIIHTLLANHFTSLAEHISEKHTKKRKGKTVSIRVTFTVEILRFLGEVEVAFALWAIPLLITIFSYYNWKVAVDYLNSRSYVEPLFVVVIMCVASTRPIIKIAECGVHGIAKILGGSSKAWWFTLLTLGPILGSFITEVGAMTLCAYILERRFYRANLSKSFSYGTLGLLFSNISVGGLFTTYAAPPILIIARKWNWDSLYVFKQFGWKAFIGIVIANIAYFLFFRKEFNKIDRVQKQDDLDHNIDDKKGPIPIWIAIVHVLVLVWIVFNSHYPAMFIGTFLLFLGFFQATLPHQSVLNIKRPLLVGLFLAGLIIHGGMQGWWIEWILGGLNEKSVVFVGMLLTAFNDNAAITYLASMMTNLSEAFKYSLVATALAGGGLTVIANTPNPVGQMILKKHFRKGISPLYLFLAAIVPTVIFLLVFLLIR
ncbi:MAG TPA: putative Na+/H+ antiporter [Rhabdochlamydiaceae bacterium]|nr:putative Na+/H+ antiporter [Rhabdochlamydiaceae bacterium]